MCQIIRQKWQLITLVVIVWLIYTGFSLATPLTASANSFHISALTYTFIKISVALPFLACWLYAVIGWLHFHRYIDVEHEDGEKRAFSKIARGLLFLIIGLIVPTVVRTIYLYFNQGANQEPAWVITSNYVSIIFPLLGFYWMLRGSWDLLKKVETKVTTWSVIITTLMPVALLALFYIGLIFTNPSRQVSSDSSIPATYFLPDILIVLTIIIPVIATWIMGLLLALNLEFFSHHTSAAHKPALINLYNGVLAITGSTILLQALGSLGANRFTNLNLGLILIIIYVLLAIIAMGYRLIASGAQKLSMADSRPANA